ncbi:MAG TPA: response regulator transcription factor, partial [Actinomycetota bacterium]
MVGVLLVDPEPFFGEALSAAIHGQDGVEVLGRSTDEREALRMCAQRSPDVVLTEVALDAGSGLNLARRLGGDTRVVVLTRRPEGDVLLDSVDAGAVGCLGHDLSVERLLQHLRDVVDRGRFAVNPDSLHETLRRATATAAGDALGVGRLTPREREVLSLVARGLDNARIANALYLSPHTVRTHVGNILRKLEVHSRAEAARV